MLFFILAACIPGWARAECHNGTIIASGLTCDEKQLIVNLHNDLRNQVASGELDTQPNAANMIEMRWSEPVAVTAKEWGDRCVFEHDPDLAKKHLGQNLAIWAYSVYQNRSEPESRMKDIKELIKLWSDEVNQYGYNGTYEAQTGHYSQMIWGSTTHVGCGLTYYDKEGTFFIYLVCNYSPPGNWLGLSPYVYGNQTCDDYNLYESTSYSDLCATDKKKVLVCNSTEEKKIDEEKENKNILEYKMKGEDGNSEDLKNSEDKNKEGVKIAGDEKEEDLIKEDMTTEDNEKKENSEMNKEDAKIADNENDGMNKEDTKIADNDKKENDNIDKEDKKKVYLIDEGIKKVKEESEESSLESVEENIEKKENCICK